MLNPVTVCLFSTFVVLQSIVSVPKFFCFVGVKRRANTLTFYQQKEKKVTIQAVVC